MGEKLATRDVPSSSYNGVNIIKTSNVLSSPPLGNAIDKFQFLGDVFT